MIVLSVLIAYCLGSISTSTLIGKWVGNIDIRKHGSGNAGATNTLRVLGLKWAIIVLLVDVLKGVVAILLARWLGHGDALYIYASGLAVIFGHNWPVFFQFRGGKGVATTIGVLILTMIQPALIAGVVAIAIVAITRWISLGSLTFTALTCVVAMCLHEPTSAIVFSALVAVMSIYRHRANIVRLMKGEEHRIFSSKS
jgi:acyl phosphate:glycerol-3-phosphate acyltransferase